MSDFDDLTSARHAAQDFVAPHLGTISSFFDPESDVLLRYPGETFVAEPGKEVRRLTSTYTALESMLEADSKGRTTPQYEWAQQRLRSYTRLAIAHPEQWTSEGSAWIYCRVRSLGVASRHCTDELRSSSLNENVRLLLDDVWSSVSGTVGAYGVRELIYDPHEPASDKIPPDYYPPNAYHTYWAVATTVRLHAGDIWSGQLQAATDWLRSQLATQIAYAASASEHFDPQQLAWAIAGIALRATYDDLVDTAPTCDLITEGLRTFFAQQSERGEWPRGKPLFNYSGAGNAYCYIFETLAELLSLATDPLVPSQKRFQTLLRPHWPSLVRALEYADATAVPLGSAQHRGWVSGHHPHRRKPESWATASVFRFAQQLRVLLGTWANEKAQELLRARLPREGLETIRARGGTWDLGWGSAGVQLSCSYVNPLRAQQDETPSTPFKDPDGTVIPATQCRSAILYGPPGTGKTTLVEAVAGALEWPFIEVTPAQFLDQGLDMVSARADQIFRQMMELDHCVILLDEIDELVRSRSTNPEPLERFFTTTMLPRLSKLWDAGKVIFFANTNDIVGVDPAIRRSQRFDAAILVMPPGPEAKRQSLQKVGVQLPKDIFDIADNALRVGDGSLPEADRPLLWLALLRYDQMDEFGRRLRDGEVDKTVTKSEVIAALGPFADDLKSQDWSHGTASDKDFVTKKFSELIRSQRRELVKLLVVESDGESPGDAERIGTSRFWILRNVGPNPLSGVNPENASIDPAGRFRIES